MVSYINNGRDAALADLKLWMKDNLPLVVPTANNFTFTNRAKQAKILKEKVFEFKQRARISVAWREDLSNRLRIQDKDVVRGTNTIIEMFEKEIADGGTVRLANFGDIKTKHFEDGSRVYFHADESWVQSINDPLYMDNIGLKRKYTKKKLTRRDV